MKTIGTPAAWLSIELRHLAALQAVVEEKSFVRAADRLGYTQSAISNQIAALERLVAARLVERARGGRSIALTDAGQLLYEHAVALTARLHAARNDVSAAQSESAQPLRVGYCPSVGVYALPRIVQSFAENFPCVQLEFGAESDQDELQRAVAEGALDLAFVSESPGSSSLGSVHLFEEAFVLLAAIEPERVARECSPPPLLAFPPDRVQSRHEAEILGSPGATWEFGPVVRLDDAATIQALVAVGWGYGLLPELAISDTGLYAEPLGGPRREIHLAWRRERALSDALTGFIDVAESEFETFRDQYEYVGSSH